MTATAPEQGALDLRVHRGPEQLGLLAEEWGRLVEATDAELELFLITCRHRPQVLAPWALSVWRGSRCEAILFGRLERAHVRPSLGYARLPAVRAVRLTVPHAGLLGRVEAGVARPMVGRLLALLEEWGADFCSIAALREESGLWAALAARPGQTLGVRSPEWTRRWVLELGPEPDFLLRRMRAKHRTWHHRKERELEAAHPGGVNWRWLAACEDPEWLGEQLEEVACQTYQRGLEVGFRHNPETREQLAWLARRGRLRVMLLEVGGRPGGFWLGSRCRDTFHAHATGYLPSLRRFEVGTALVRRLTAELVREGVARLEWGPGDVDYKQRFGTRAWREARVDLFGRTHRSRWLRRYKAVGDVLGRWLHQLAGRLGVWDRLKQAWRRRLAAG